MKSPALLPIFVLSLLSVLVLPACADDREQLAEFCTDLRDLQKEPASCEELGEKMLTLTRENQAILNKVRQMDQPADEELDAWHAAMRPCFEAHLEISLGNCAGNPEVQEALKAFGE